MDNSELTFQFNGTETVIIFNIIGNLIDANAIQQDQIETIQKLHKSIYDKLQPYIVQSSSSDVDVSGAEVDVSGAEVDVSGAEVDVEDDGSGVGECEDGVCKLQIPPDCCDTTTDCSNN